MKYKNFFLKKEKNKYWEHKNSLKKQNQLTKHVIVISIVFINTRKFFKINLKQFYWFLKPFFIACILFIIFRCYWWGIGFHKTVLVYLKSRGMSFVTATPRVLIQSSMPNGQTRSTSFYGYNSKGPTNLNLQHPPHT